MLISFMMAYRGRVETNASLSKMFETFAHYNRFNYDEVEFLVRLDSDDRHGITMIKNMIGKFPFLKIKPFTHHRWEGRWSIDYDYQYLLKKKTPDSKCISFITDDIVFNRNFMDDVKNNLTDYSIVGDFQHPMTKEKLDLVEDYHNINWLTPDYICAYPILSSKLAEVMCNMGYQVNVDSTLALINVIMYKKYGLILGKHIEHFLLRENVDRTDKYGSEFDSGWEMNDGCIAKDPYFFRLVEQQVKNIYLNMKDEIL